MASVQRKQLSAPSYRGARTWICDYYQGKAYSEETFIVASHLYFPTHLLFNIGVIAS